MKEWRWLSENAVLAGHDEQLAEHGGSVGMRDMDMLRSTLARPQNKAAYEDDADAALLAAAYAFGISRNHPFVDGNKRAALLAAEAFLLDNGFELIADDAATLQMMTELASGNLTEEACAAWIRENVSPLEERICE
jgi:death on curing protein